MKKIAFMFAAAALMVACGQKTPEIVLNGADSAQVLKQTVEAWQAGAEVSVNPEELVFPEEATAEDSAAVVAQAMEAALAAWNEANPADSTNAAFNEILKANLAAALEAKKAAAAQPKEGEQPAEGEQEGEQQ